MIWISYFPTKNVLRDQNQTFSKRDFSAVGFLDLLKTQRQKSLFLYKSDFHWQSNYTFLWFDSQTHGFSLYLGRDASKQCSAALTKAKKFFTTWGLFISAISLFKLISETRVYMCPKNMKCMGFFYRFLKVFAKKIHHSCVPRSISYF